MIFQTAKVRLLITSIVLFSLLFSFYSLLFKNTKLAFSALATHVVISEVQVRGVDIANDEFIEIYNPTDNPIDISTWSIQMENNSGNFFRKNFVSGNSIPAHGYFLITNSDYNGSVTPDMSHSSFAMSSTGTSIFLVNDQVTLAEGNEVTIVDKVSIGSIAPDPEGTPFSTVPEEDGSVERLPGNTDPTGGNGEDTNNNSLDFALRVTSEPQNAVSQIEVPATPTVTPTTDLSPTENVTPTIVATSTPTVELTPTLTTTPSPEPSLTPTETPTPTLTPSPEPTVTVTPSPEPTITVTPTPDPTLTVTPTTAPTATLTPTTEPSATPTEISSPTVTPTNEPTLTPTISPEPTITVTPTVEPTPTLTVTPSPVPTATMTPTPEPSNTPTVTPEPTPTQTPSPTITTTPMPTVHFTAYLNGVNEVPPVDTPASGLIDFAFDPNDNTFNLTGVLNNIGINDLTGSHIHTGAVGAEGAVIVDLGLSNWEEDNGNLKIVLTNVSFPSDFVDELNSGNTYVNIHTIDFPDGEVRAQLLTGTPSPTLSPSPVPTFTVTPTPEPTMTVTPSPEPTITMTPTSEPTVTITPMPTFTVTPSPEPTPTLTPSPVPTFTPTPSPVPTLTPTTLPTATPTQTLTPTMTITPTPVPTITPTPTLEPTLTPTVTPIERPTPTSGITQTPTPLPSLTPTSTPRNGFVIGMFNFPGGRARECRMSFRVTSFMYSFMIFPRISCN